jgi:protocatechuate 3,4-dioxygenase beta subunit
MSTNHTHEEDLDSDDEIKGRVLSRREVLALMGSAGAAVALVACTGSDSPEATPTSAAPQASTGSASSGSTVPAAATATPATTAVPSCVVVPELTEGPYFVDENINRSDIRSDTNTGTIKPGTPLTLTFNVSQVTAQSCAWLPNAKVDIWHCDAQGAYSDVQDPNAGSTRGQTFLRGYQMTDANGKASFTTIYPGWYPGRAVHIHFKIRVENKEFTSQLFFDDTLSTQVFQQAMYQKSGNRTMNANDSIYRQAGDVLLLKLTKSGDAYTASFDCGMRV